MELSDVVRARRMIRRFDGARPVSRADIENMLKLAIRAPSAGHTQAWRFSVLDDITSRGLFWESTSDGAPDRWRTGMTTAPALIVCWSHRDAYLDRYALPDKGWSDRAVDRWPIPYWHVDVGMAGMIILLAAQDLGLGACWFGVPGAHWDALRGALGVPDGHDPVGVVALGHPDPAAQSRPSRRQRRDSSAMIDFVADRP